METETEYDEGGFLRRLQTICFGTKQGSCAVSALWLSKLIGATVLAQ
jgi:hypothetical protein